MSGPCKFDPCITTKQEYTYKQASQCNFRQYKSIKEIYQDILHNRYVKDCCETVPLNLLGSKPVLFSGSYFKFMKKFFY